jgi:hormone-sensitive lipase
MLMDHMMEGSMNASIDDIFYKAANSEEWKAIEDSHYVDVVEFTDKDFKKKMAEFQKATSTVLAAASSQMENSQVSLETLLGIGMNAIYYGLFPSKRKLQSEKFISNENPEITTKLMSLADSEFTYPFMRLAFPSIKFHTTILVPKLLPRLTVNSYKVDEDLSAFLNFSGSIGDLLQKFNGTLYPILNEMASSYVKEKLKEVPDDLVKVRIISPSYLPKGSKKEPLKNMKFDKILIDIHGGGFIATTSRCHQTYLRKWAKEAKIVLFAIDYKLAPAFKYPYILDEVWQAYFWIITHAEKEFGLKPNTVLVAGDSAGGNLAMALTLRAIHSNFRVPDGLLLGYPALNLAISAFTPSLLTSMDDFILTYSFLNVCINSYIPPDADPKKDPYLSPSLITDEDLKKFPPIRILAAGMDPLRDESYKLMYRLIKLKKNARMIEYRMLPHGFWSFYSLHSLKEFKVPLDSAVKAITELIEINQSKEGLK